MKKICFVFYLLLWASSLFAQNSVRGIVVNESTDLPIVGAVVTASGRGTVTDSMGYFSLRVNAFPAELRITFTGFDTKVLTLVGAADTLRILLRQSTGQLEDVTVSTGYRLIPRERATGSFAFIDNRNINLQTSPNILDRLPGMVAGLVTDPRDGRPPISIRGLSTINGPKDPLIILDNFPYEGSITNINPADVETITVLKDAAAASIWGARAANGVIVITTKKGKFSQKLLVSAGSNVTIRNRTDLFYQQLPSSAEYIDLEKFLFAKGYYTSAENNTSRPALSPVVETLIAVRDGKITSAAGDAIITGLAKNDIRRTLYDNVYTMPVLQQYFVNMRSGSATTASFLSAGYDRSFSELSARSERITLRSDQKIKLSRIFQLSVNAAYTNDRSRSGDYGYGITLPGTSALLYNYADLNAPMDVMRRTYTDTAGAGKLLPWKFDYLRESALNPKKAFRNDVVLNTSLQTELTHRLRLDLHLMKEWQTTDTKTDHALESFFSSNAINRLTQIDKTTGKLTYIVPKGNILDQSYARLSSTAARAQLSYDLSQKDHRINAMAGTEVRELRSASDGYRLYGYNPENLSYTQVDYVNTYPLYTTGSKVNITDNTDLTNTLSRFVSLYADGAYTFRSRYTLSASARKDASNIFGLEANDKWRPLWSVGGAWDLSREPFYKLHAFSLLKLRATYGFSGNVDNTKSAVTVMNYIPGALTTNFTYGSIRQFANPSLRWEKTATLNFGLDFRTKFLEGSLEYYRKRSTDLYGNAPMDYTTGVGDRIVKNVADLLTTGVDLAVRAQILRGKFGWSANANVSYNKNRVIKNNLTSINASGFVGGGFNVSAVEGNAVYAIYSYRFAGLDPVNGDPMGYVNGAASKVYTTLTGSATTVYDLVYHGPSTPVFFGSLLNEFSFSRFRFSVMTSFKAGHYFKRSTINYSSFFSNGIAHGDYSLRWQKPGDENFTTVPSLVYPAVAARDNFYAGAEVLAEKADHVRLEFIRCAYQLKKFSFFLNASNLGILWRANDQGIDPDYVTGYPQSRSFTLGLQFNY